MGRQAGAFQAYLRARLYGAAFAVVAFGVLGLLDPLAWVVASAAVLVLLTTAVYARRPFSDPATLVIWDALIVLGAVYVARPYPGAEATGLALTMASAVVFGSGRRVRYTTVFATIAASVIGYVNWVVREPPLWTDQAMMWNAIAGVVTVAPMVWWMAGFVSAAYEFRPLFAVALEDPLQLTGVVAEQSAEGVGVVDCDGVVAYANPSLHATLGQAAGSLIGRPIDGVFDTTSQIRLRAALEEALSQPIETIRNVEVTVVGASGEQRELLVSATGLPTKEGPRVLLALRDITDIVRMQREVIASKDRFIASVSHELRTPLTAVVAYSEMLTGDEELDAATQNEYLLTIGDQARDLTLLVEDLLVATRLDSDSLGIRVEPTMLDEHVRRAAQAWLLHHQIAMDLDSLGVVAEVDPQRLRQIVRNLVSNAVKHGGDHIEVFGRQGVDRHEVVVRDDGEGVPPELIAKIFEPYGRVDRPEGLPESVGLGLFVSRGLARAMGGSLGYERIDGRTSFVLAVPLDASRPLPHASDEGPFEDDS